MRSPLFESMMDALPLAIAVIDLDDVVLAWNRASETLFDIPRVRALGETLTDLGLTERLPGLRARVDEAKDASVPLPPVPLALERRDAESVDLALAVAPVMDQEADLVGFVVCAEDRTLTNLLAEENAYVGDELRRIAEDLQVVNEELLAANGELLMRIAELQAQEPARRIVEFVDGVRARVRGTLATPWSGSEPRLLRRARTAFGRRTRHLARWLDPRPLQA